MTNTVQRHGSAEDTERTRSVGIGILAFWTILAAVGGLWWMVDPDAQHFTLGAAGCIIVSIPLTRSWNSLVSPWTIVVLIVFIGGGLRGLAISAGFETGTRDIDSLFLRGEGTDYFLNPTLLYLGGLVLLTLGYLARSVNKNTATPHTWLADHRFNRSAALPLATFLAALGFAAFVLYAQRTGGLSPESLSAKRTFADFELDSDYQRHGVLLFVNNLSAIALWIVTAHYAALGHRISPLTKQGWIVAVFAVNALLLPFYDSSRTDAVVTLMAVLCIVIVVNPRLIRWRSIVIGIMTLLALLSLMTMLRSASTASGSGLDSSTDALKTGFADALVYNRNLGDPYVTSHIVHHVPAPISFQHGDTITIWLVAPVPRALWPDKPVVNIGPVIGYHIYGTQRGGVPPGLMGDLYLNFGSIGLLFGSFIVGVLLGRVDEWRRRYRGLSSPAFAVLYVPLALIFAKTAMSKGLGAAVFHSATQLGLTVLALGWMSLAQNRKDRNATSRLTR